MCDFLFLRKRKPNIKQTNSMPKLRSNFHDLLDILPLAAVAVVLMGTMALLSSRAQSQEEILGSQAPTAAGPVLTNNVPMPQISAKAAYAFDLSTGTVLLDKNGQEPMLPASTTKMATAMVALEAYQPDEVLTVGKLSVPGQNMGLVEGEKINFLSLLYGLLVSSGNDAAEVLAANYPGGRENFILAMNRLAQNAGFTKTHFVNPTGFDAYLHFSTAKELAFLAEDALRNPLFSQIVATPETTVTSVDGKIKHKLVSTNKLLGKTPGVLGVKTGSTAISGESLVTLIDRDNHKVIISVLDSSDRFGDTEALINWIFSNYRW